MKKAIVAALLLAFAGLATINTASAQDEQHYQRVTRHTTVTHHRYHNNGYHRENSYYGYRKNNRDNDHRYRSYNKGTDNNLRNDDQRRNDRGDYHREESRQTDIYIHK